MLSLEEAIELVSEQETPQETAFHRIRRRKPRPFQGGEDCAAASRQRSSTAESPSIPRGEILLTV
jgi:hypothetical protein